MNEQTKKGKKRHRRQKKENRFEITSHHHAYRYKNIKTQETSRLEKRYVRVTELWTSRIDLDRLQVDSHHNTHVFFSSTEIECMSFSSLVGSVN